MNILKRIFTSATGYWIHKLSTLPVGTNMYIDIHRRINYGALNIMFDVGANTGQTWVEFRRNEPLAKIYCFEPVLETFQELKKNTINDENCIIENCAFGSEEGEKTIHLFDKNSPLNSLRDDIMNSEKDARQEVIKIKSLDDYCKRNNIQKIDLLKIDTEGYELMVLEGSKNMLKSKSISFIYCEVGFLKRSIRHTHFSELTEWLADKGYYFFGLYQLVSNGWKEGDYFGNALFVHKDVFTP